MLLNEQGEDLPSHTKFPVFQLYNRRETFPFIYQILNCSTNILIFNYKKGKKITRTLPLTVTKYDKYFSF